MKHEVVYIRRNSQTGEVLEVFPTAVKGKADAKRTLKAMAREYRLEFSELLMKAENFVGLGGVECRYEVDGEDYRPEPEQD